MQLLEELLKAMKRFENQRYVRETRSSLGLPFPLTFFFFFYYSQLFFNIRSFSCICVFIVTPRSNASPFVVAFAVDGCP